MRVHATGNAVYYNAIQINSKNLKYAPTKLKEEMQAAAKFSTQIYISFSMKFMCTYNRTIANFVCSLSMMHGGRWTYISIQYGFTVFFYYTVSCHKKLLRRKIMRKDLTKQIVQKIAPPQLDLIRWLLVVGTHWKCTARKLHRFKQNQSWISYTCSSLLALLLKEKKNIRPVDFLNPSYIQPVCRRLSTEALYCKINSLLPSACGSTTKISPQKQAGIRTSVQSRPAFFYAIIRLLLETEKVAFPFRSCHAASDFFPIGFVKCKLV